jgi:hypothetical protein
MKYINIDNVEIEPGWEWFVFKKRSQGARRAKHKVNKKEPPQQSDGPTLNGFR